MDLFKLFRKNKEHLESSNICGEWILYKDDPVYGKAGAVSIEFHTNGRLNYKIEEESKINVVCLTYYIDGNELVTDQPSSPKKERTRFVINSDGILILEYEGRNSFFKRKKVKWKSPQ